MGCSHLVRPFNDLSFLNPDYFSQVGAHNPTLVKISCWDARMSGPIHTLPLGQVFNPRSAGATVAKDIHEDNGMMDYLCLADTKGVKQFLMVPHSDCLAAEIALRYPRVEMLPSDHKYIKNMQRIHGSLTRVGANLSEFSEKCWDEGRDIVVCEGSSHRDLDARILDVSKSLMAKRLSVVSLANLMEARVIDDQTRTIGEAVRTRDVNVAVVFADLLNDRFEYLGLDTSEFHPIDLGDTPSHMCARHNDCDGCHCGNKVIEIANAIAFAPRVCAA